MTESHSDSLRRRAVQLVLVKKLPPGQAAKILQCTSRGVRRWVQEYLDQQPPPDLNALEQSAFVPVTLTESLPPASGISIRLTTATELVLHFRLANIQDVIELIKALEVKPC
jgi:transposase-like protein